MPAIKSVKRAAIKTIFIVSGCLFFMGAAGAAENYDMKFEASYKDGMVNITGETNLPEGSLVRFYLRRFDKSIFLKEVNYRDGRFRFSLNLSGKVLPPGEYTVKAESSLNVKPDPKKKKKEKKIVPPEYKRVFNVGSRDEILLKSSEIREMILSDIEVLKKLNSELDDKYVSNRANFNKDDWKDWSDSWFIRLRQVAEKYKKDSEINFVPLFPDSEENIRYACELLAYIYQKYCIELEYPQKSIGTMLSIFSKMEVCELESELNRSLAIAKKEIQSL